MRHFNLCKTLSQFKLQSFLDLQCQQFALHYAAITLIESLVHFSHLQVQFFNALRLESWLVSPALVIRLHLSINPGHLYCQKFSMFMQIGQLTF